MFFGDILDILCFFCQIFGCLTHGNCRYGHLKICVSTRNSAFICPIIFGNVEPYVDRTIHIFWYVELNVDRTVHIMLVIWVIYGSYGPYNIWNMGNIWTLRSKVGGLGGGATR